MLGSKDMVQVVCVAVGFGLGMICFHKWGMLAIPYRDCQSRWIIRNKTEVELQWSENAKPVL
jgi:hypothetical protein